ncbi:hypothetical protein [Tropicibacter alexandrii]|nr:hypothetical protein [Tropicibacter alexandrii]
MRHDSLRRAAPRPKMIAAARPRPTAAAALLLASVLSLPFLALAVVQLAL